MLPNFVVYKAYKMILILIDQFITLNTFKCIHVCIYYCQQNNSVNKNINRYDVKINRNVDKIGMGE